MIYINGKKASRLYAGGKEVKSAYRGGKKIFGKSAPIPPQPQTGDFGTLKWKKDGQVYTQPVRTFADFCSLCTDPVTHQFGNFSFSPAPTAQNVNGQTQLSYLIPTQLIIKIPDYFLYKTDIGEVGEVAGAKRNTIYEIGNFCFSDMAKLTNQYMFNVPKLGVKGPFKIGHDSFSGLNNTAQFAWDFRDCTEIGGGCFSGIGTNAFSPPARPRFDNLKTIRGDSEKYKASFSLIMGLGSGDNIFSFPNLETVDDFDFFSYYSYKQDTASFNIFPLIISVPKLKTVLNFGNYSYIKSVSLNPDIDLSALPLSFFTHAKIFGQSGAQFKFTIYQNSNYGILGGAGLQERTMFQNLVIDDGVTPEFEFQKPVQIKPDDTILSFTQGSGENKTFVLSGVAASRIKTILPDRNTAPYRKWTP